MLAFAEQGVCPVSACNVLVTSTAIKEEAQKAESPHMPNT